MTGDRRGPEDEGWFGGQPRRQQQPYPQEQYQQGYDPYAQQQQQQQQHQQQQQQYYQQQQPGYPPQQDYYQQQSYEQQHAYEQQSYDQQSYEQPQAYYQQQGYYQQQPYEQPQAYYQQPTQPVAPPAPPVQAAPPVVPPARPAPAPAAPPRPRPAEPAAAAVDEPSEQVGGRSARSAAAADSYTTGEFTFVDEESTDSEDVIDWLKFAESRSEVRAERRRRLKNRLIGAAVVLALAGGATGGYLWWTKHESTSTARAVGGRQVNVVHLRDLTGKVTTALLVDDESGRKGTVLLLPDTLKLPSSGDSATVTVGQAMDAVGPSATRDGLSTVLGAKVAGTWRLDTPYLQLLVAQLGGVRVDVNAEVRQDNKPDGKVLAQPGKQVLLNGAAAVAYATLQAQGEGRDAQMARFGQVLEAVIRTMPTALDQATDDVHRMNSVADPSLPEKALAGVLAQLAQLAKDGHLSTATLQARPDGTLDEATAGAQVKDILGGTVQNAQGTGGTTRVAIVNASGNDAAGTSAGVQVQNAGLDVLPATKANPQATSEVRYADDAKQPAAKALATSLGLPDSAVKKVTDAQNADLVLVVGKDYQVPKTP
ncbi:LCP family protein [Kitasatospora cinereorecta]